MNRRQSLVVLGAAAVSHARAADDARIRLEAGQDKVRVLAGDAPFTTVHFSREYDRPFVHPLVTPSGVIVSRGVPPSAGEAEDHAWHRGLWWAHGDISGADFWREKVDPASGRKTTGTIRVTGAPKIEGSAVTLRCALTTAEGKVIGTCLQRFAFARMGGHNVIDAGVTLVADGGIDLVMGDSDDGGLAIRLTREFEEKHGAALLSSEGARGTKALWGKAARWVDYSGTKDGRACGVAILDHPSNLRYPTQWHARGYGLNSANPFAAGSFGGAKGSGQWTIAKGSRLAMRYRVVLHDGDAQQAGIDGMQRGWK